MAARRGRQFLHTPGPTAMPDRILQAMARPALDHRGPEFLRIAERCFAGLKRVFRTERPVSIYPAAGHGAWEAALANVCAPGDRVLMCETGAFSQWWKEMAEALGLAVDYLPGDWRSGADPAAVEAHLAADRGRVLRAVAVVHNETSTGVASRIAEVREAIDAAGHPALLLVDTISSLASMDFRMDEWGVDVAVGGSQKGLMLPPGLGFTGVSEKAFRASRANPAPRSYWDWRATMPDGETAGFVCTPPINLMFGLAEALDMLEEEGLEACFARHRRLAGATRSAVAGWGLEINARDAREASDSVSAVRLPEGHDAEAVRRIARERHDVVLGVGILRLAGRAFRIGHMGDLNAPMLLGALASVQAALAEARVPHDPRGILAAIDRLTGDPAEPG